MRILHCITGLSGDGAQRMLLRVGVGLARFGFQNWVVSLSPREPLAEEFEEGGVSVFSLGMGGATQILSTLGALREVIHKVQPDIIQGWMYHANVAVTLAQVGNESSPVMWNIRRGLDDLEQLKFTTRVAIRASRMLSGYPARIIYCNRVSHRQHSNFGFPAERGVVIENGFDTMKFHPRPYARSRVSQMFGIPEDGILIGNVARYDCAKGHGDLIRAFSAVIQKCSLAKLVLIGRGLDNQNPEVMNLIRKHNVERNVYLLGERRDVDELHSAFDLYCSSSISEGFPNAVAEAMSSGVPCVVTDTGASRELVDGLGRVVPTRSPEILKGALLEMISLDSHERLRLGALSRDRIINQYSLPSIVSRYAEIYRNLAQVGSGREAA